VTTPDVHRTIDAVWKLESARIVGGLARIVRDVGLAEELAQDALVAALEQWPDSGVPDNPGAWLTTVARRRAVDHIRRAQRTTVTGDEPVAAEAEDDDRDDDRDDVLRLIFVCCHPVLPREARVALTLRLVGGLTAYEIARAFLQDEPQVVRRIGAAKQILADAGVGFARPDAVDLPERLGSVLEVLYLIFNEGYAATTGQDLIRADLCREALRLVRMLAELAPGEAEVHGLVALMELQASRTAARTGPGGELILLHEQNRGRWDQLLIRRGFAAMLRARAIKTPPGPYVLQAAIAVCHAQASTAAATDWVRIVALYDALIRLLPTPVVRLNRAVAVGMAQGPSAGLAAADALLSDPALRDYYLLPAVRGDLLARLHRPAEARLEFERARTLTRNDAERQFLRTRADQMGTPSSSVTLGDTVAAFLARDDLEPATVRSYRQTFVRLSRAVGDGLPLADLTADRLSEVCTTAWGSAGAATWNRHRSALRSFAAWSSRPELAESIPRRAALSPARAPVPVPGAIWDDARFSVRERTLWRMLSESGAAVSAVLALDVENLDLDDRRARAGRRWISWRSGTAQLLPSLIAGRTAGPLFLTDRRPAPGAVADRCPHTGRARLSYERAEYLFKRASGGRTLSCLRAAAR
jgi:RNA polymerase sigma factor (sigma-70 family)